MRGEMMEGSWKTSRRKECVGKKRGRQMEEGSFIVSSLRIESLSRQGEHGRWANQTIMASINCFLDCALTVKFNVSS